MGEDWRWKPKEGPGPAGSGLLYEPGNWGDVLKGTWAWLLLRRLLRAEPADPLVIIDPFAGAPVYPLSAAARRRLEEIEGHPFARIQEPFAAQGLLASTGRALLEEAGRSGRRVELRVFDADPARRAAWEPVGGASIAAGVSGEEVLGAWLDEGSLGHLLIVDPYDLFDHWGRLRTLLGKAARRCPTLIYLYNKSPRGAGHYDQYRRLIRGLASALPSGVAGVVGRAPSDARLPRAWHEVILLGTESSLGEVEAELRSSARDLAGRLAAAGSFERL